MPFAPFGSTGVITAARKVGWFLYMPHLPWSTTCSFGFGLVVGCVVENLNSSPAAFFAR